MKNDTNDFTVTSNRGDCTAGYVGLAPGKKRDVANDLGWAFADENGVDGVVTVETSVASAFATGAMVRAEEWKTVISAGDTE